MKIHSSIYAFLIALVILAGCKSTGQKALSKGEYYTACMQAIEKLRSSPDNAKAIDALKQAYPLAINYTEREVERLLASPSDRNKYLKMYDLYSDLNKIAVEISRSPGALRVIPYPDYYNSQLESARNMAAEEAYRNAETTFRVGTRIAAKEAYLQYLQANNIINGYKDALSKAQEAKWAATVKVVVEQVPVRGSYKLTADFFQSKVFEYFSNNIRNEFIRVYSPEEAEKTRLKPDQIIRLEFLDFIVGQTRQNKDTREVKRDSVIIGTTTDRRGQKLNVYGTVKATITIRTTEVSSTGVLNAIIMDYSTNKILSQQRFPGTYVWRDQWGTFNGDERALNSKELAMCKREPMMPPPPQDLFIQFTVPIYNNLTSFIQNFYRKY